METMGSVFFHLWSQTCPGQGLWAARMWPARRFLEEGQRLAGDAGPMSPSQAGEWAGKRPWSSHLPFSEA